MITQPSRTHFSLWALGLSCGLPCLLFLVGRRRALPSRAGEPPLTPHTRPSSPDPLWGLPHPAASSMCQQGPLGRHKMKCREGKAPFPGGCWGELRCQSLARASDTDRALPWGLRGSWRQPPLGGVCPGRTRSCFCSLGPTSAGVPGVTGRNSHTHI